MTSWKATCPDLENCPLCLVQRGVGKTFRLGWGWGGGGVQFLIFVVQDT